MKYIKYYNDKISKLSLGTVQFGLEYGIGNSNGKPSQESVNRIINYVINNNINCFDTAQAYGDSEKVLGKSLENISRTMIISKLKSNLFRNNGFANVLKSLDNLNIDILFALLMHDSKILYDWDSSDTNIVNTLIGQNKIKYFGVSIYSSKDFELAINNDSVSIIQIPFNIFDQRAYKEQWFEKAKAKNKLIFIRSVYLQGLLLMEKEKVPEKLKDSKKYIDILDQLCIKFDMTRNELALSYVDSIATDSLLLFGCETIEQATENLNNYNSIKVLDNEDILTIEKLFSSVSENIYNPTRW